MFIMLKKDKYRKPETAVWDFMVSDHNDGAMREREGGTEREREREKGRRA